jgi:hypothetical protein
MKARWFAFLLAACTTGPQNGTTTNVADVAGKTFNFTGYYDEPNATIHLQVLKDPTRDPDIDTNWTTFATTTSGTSEVHVNSDDPLYQWSVTAAPVPPNATATQRLRWPQGGIARVRAYHQKSDGTKQILYTFDDVTFDDCLNEQFQADADWRTIGSVCAGIGSHTIGLVSTNPIATPTGGFLTKKGIGSAANTVQYYLNNNLPLTLTAFKNRFSFPNGEVTARYFNDGDLGLGREMHCKSFPSTFGLGVACYVTNYSGVDGEAVFNRPVDEVIAQTNSGHGGFATVAMIYTPLPTSSNSVQFVVYNKDGVAQFEAPLDVAQDNVSIPQNCLSCHGIDATYGGTTVSNKAEFLPFDPFAFKFASSGSFTLSAQQEKFRQLNALVKLANPTAATVEFIDGMYAPSSVTTPGATAKDDFIPAAWEPNGTLDGKAVYNGIVKRYCRTCHISSNKDLLDFNEWDDFTRKDPAASPPIDQLPKIRFNICGSHAMPHAERVMKKFWESGARAYLSTGFDGLTQFPEALLECKP